MAFKEKILKIFKKISQYFSYRDISFFLRSAFFQKNNYKISFFSAPMGISRGFSMMELLFVLVILGILASLALPRINFSRTNALSIAIQSDIQTIISSTQEYAIMNEISPQNANPQWLISYLNLSPQRWIANGDSLKIAKNGRLDSENDCLSIRFDQTDFLQVNFNFSSQSNLCKNLLKNYTNNITVPLNIAL